MKRRLRSGRGDVIVAPRTDRRGNRSGDRRQPDARRRRGCRPGLVATVLVGALGSRALAAAQTRVLLSGGFAPAYQTLLPRCERATGHAVVTERGASLGNAPKAIPGRVRRGEPADVLIMDGDALDDLSREGYVVAGTRVDLARSRIGLAVRAGRSHPDISSVGALVGVLRNAGSIAYSASSSGVYLATQLFPRLGLAEELRSKSRQVTGEPVGAVVARGEADLGFQQMSELLAVPGIEVVGPLPEPLQKVTVFAAGVASRSGNRDAARALITCLASPEAAPIIRTTGMEPASVGP
jgi:molybdate transport system substrate-binding protein